MKAILIPMLCALLGESLHAGFTDADWHRLGLGGGFIDGSDVWYHAVTADASGNIYVGGRFEFSGSEETDNVAKWNGATWVAMGTGLPHTVRCLASDGVNVYAGGYFGGLAKWNGSSWIMIAAYNEIAPGTIECIALDGETIYVAGYISQDGGQTYQHGVARCAEGVWTVLGTTGLEEAPGVEVRTMAVLGGVLYIGGAFSHVNGVAVNNVARWNGTSWDVLGGGIDGVVESLAIHQGSLYACGSRFTGPSFVPVLVRWGGQSWTSVGDGIHALGLPRLLVSNGNDLVVSVNGAITGGTIHGVALWSGTKWRALGSDMWRDWATPVSMCIVHDQLYCVGPFPYAGNQWVGGIARADLSGIGATPYDEAITSAGLVGEDAKPDAIPFGDGVTNLIKYAFNLNLAGPDNRTVTESNDAGLPAHRVVSTGTGMVFRYEYVQRQDAGLIYTPQKCNDLNTGQWQPLESEPMIAPINDDWVRVIHEEPVTTPSCFFAVEVEMP